MEDATTISEWVSTFGLMGDLFLFLIIGTAAFVTIGGGAVWLINKLK